MSRFDGRDREPGVLHVVGVGRVLAAKLRSHGNTPSRTMTSMLSGWMFVNRDQRSLLLVVRQRRSGSRSAAGVRLALFSLAVWRSSSRRMNMR